MNTKRILAGIIDFLITAVINAVLMVLFLIMPLLNNNIDTVNILNLMARELTITYCAMMYMVIRDILGNKSIGKRIFKLKIVDKNNGEKTKFIKRFLRNITWLLGPIDIIVFLISKERLGDKIVGTNVVEQTPSYIKNANSLPNENINKSQKEWLTTLLLLIFFGTLGAHRFYVGKIGTGILMILVTFCTFGIGAIIWYIIDLIFICTGKFKDKKGFYVL
jgi:TM2 domain-containing membrane protein YozV/uncharacterized RDD family membrane protein YckC